MLIKIGNLYTTKDLNTPRRKMVSAYRSKVNVAIVDDEEFVYLDELRRSGFSLVKYDDVPDLQSLEAYPAIICDIKGVGKAFKSPFEGAYLIRELRKKYPFKVLAAYTGSTYDISINSYLEGIHIIKKDISVDEWCSEIDYLIKRVSDPKENWNKIRDMLIKEDVPLLSLAKLEHEYVNILLNKDGNFHDFPSSMKKMNLSEDVRSVIQSLIAGLILSL
ncbi:MAG: hypothetical protein BGO34_06695 [Bacteroidia bacterium 44-10]|nr:MAG: hypothetical protein BGO34_06695 [Bacteroidia bacterium 44-10]